MKKWLGTILALLPLFAAAQAPDNNRIEAEIHNGSSPFYYPNLIDRYRQGDPLLTTEDYRYLYYGYMFSPEYDPYTSIPEADSVVMILLREADLELDDYRKLIRFGNKVMEHDPFNPRNLNMLTYAYGTIGDNDNEIKSALRFNKIMDAIFSTGEGDKEDSPWHILYFSHAEDVMDYLKLQYRRPIVVSRTTEYFPLEKREGRTRGYYFDFSRVYTKKPQQTDPQPRKWKINDMPLK